MTKIRVEKSKDFSIVSNKILRDTNLSMKARFLLVFMLSLSETWEYSVVGLAKAIGCGRDAITSGLKELETYGYLERNRSRDDKGRLKETEYTLYEEPHTTCSECADEPVEEEPMQENPAQVNQAQININKTSTNLNKNKENGNARAREDDAAAVFKMFSDNIHPVSGAIEADELHDMVATYGAEWVKSAIKEAVECNGRSVRYIRGILRNWQARGQKGSGMRGKNRLGARTSGANQEVATRAWEDEPDTL